MPKAKLLAYCDDCEHSWIPDKSRGKLRCNKCGGRDVVRAAPDEILDRVREKASKDNKAERVVRGGVCPTCGARPGCVCRWCGAGFSSYRARIKHVRDKHPERVKQPGGQRKEGAQDLSLEESKEPSIVTEARREHLETAEERRRAREERAAADDSGKGASKPTGRGKSEDTEQPIHKKIGVKADKLERIVADFERAEKRSELDEHGIPLISEEHNIEWIHLVGKVTWRTAHKIFHEVLMPDAECTLPIGYKRYEWLEL